MDHEHVDTAMGKPMQRIRITRRSVMSLLGAGALAGVLAACGSAPAPTAAPAPKPTEPPKAPEPTKPAAAAPTTAPAPAPKPTDPPKAAEPTKPAAAPTTAPASAPKAPEPTKPAAAAPKTAEPTIEVSPAKGNQEQVFTFSGKGFKAGTRLTVEKKSPDGQTFTLQKDGHPAVWVVSDQGTFAIEILPSRDFAGADAGTWSGKFCIEGTTECWTGTFEIAL